MRRDRSKEEARLAKERAAEQERERKRRQEEAKQVPQTPWLVLPASKHMALVVLYRFQCKAHNLWASSFNQCDTVWTDERASLVSF